MEHEEHHTEKKSNSEKFSKRFGDFHDKYYKHLLLVPLIILVLGLAYMGYFYSVNGDFMYRDISLTGGTSFTIQGSISSEQLKLDLASQLEEINTREIYNLVTGQQEAIVIQTKSSVDEAKPILENYPGYELDEKNSSIGFTGSTLSKSFFKQLLIAILIAFFFMALVVFIIFRTFIPSLAIILSAFFDIFMTLLAVNLLGIKMSTAGIVAFLMLIGYSVDTDILLTNRVLKRYGDLNSKLLSAFKTGMTMTTTSIVAVGVALIFAVSFSVVLTQIFTILFLGLLFDLLNTWITNVSILKWYVISKN